MYDLQSRYYSPEWGRFINADSLGGTLGKLLSHNIFAYCSNNPISKFDPTGYVELIDMGEGGGALCEFDDCINPLDNAVEQAEEFKERTSTYDDDISLKEEMKESKRVQLNQNRIQGEKFENEVLKKLSKTQTNVTKQITVKTISGVKIRLDIIGEDSVTWKIKISEAKSSAKAPFTTNQKLAFPEISKYGATVVGKGKIPFIGGTQITPTEIEIFRP